MEDSVDKTEGSESYIYEEIDNIDQEYAHAPVEGHIEASGSEASGSEDVCPCAAVMISSNQACECPIKEVDEGHTYKNVDLIEATTLFYTTSDGTQTYRPPEPATEVAAISLSLEQPEAIPAVNVIPPAIEEEHNQTIAADPSDDISLITTSPNQAYGCPVKKVDEGHTYTNVDLVEATTLFYTTSDGTRTYRPPEPATEVAVEQITSDATVDGTPQAITQSEAEHCHTIWAAGFSENTCLDPTASPEDVGPEEAISRSSTDTGPKQAISLVDTNSEAEDECPIMTFSNEAYGCDIEKVDESHGYENVDLEEATTLFYTTSDGTRTYRPCRKQAPAVSVRESLL